MSRGLIERVYSPVHHTIAAAKNVVNTGFTAINKIGSNVTRHADMAVSDIFSKRRRGGSRRGARTMRKRMQKKRTQRKRA
jgi:hypothetical protein